MAKTLQHVTAAILAGGMGTRLRPVVADRPKVLAPVGGRPFLTYLLDQLAFAGIRRTALLTGYQAKVIEETLGTEYGRMSLTYSTEPKPLGTGGAVRRALPLLSSATILLLNGDSFCDVDLDSFFDFHQRTGAKVSLGLARVPETGRFGKVQLDSAERIRRFEEKGPPNGEGWINAGIYLLDAPLVATVPVGLPISLERDLLPTWIREEVVCGFASAGRFLDIGTPESYARAETFFLPAGLHAA